MVDPSEVTKGDSCGCICPGCHEKLVAKQGEIIEWHFAHKAGADCASGVESALHLMAKQMIMERAQVWVPERRFSKEVFGPRDDVEGGHCWKETLTTVVCSEGLKHLTGCVEEKQIGTRRPDILASLDGQPIAIEIANTHFCDEEKIDWLKAENLSTLEIDIRMPPDVEIPDIRKQLEARLFSPSPFSSWLIHSNDTFGWEQISAAETNLRNANIEKESMFLKEVERKRKEKKRKDDFKASIRDIDFQTYKITRDLTLRVAYSQIRCTLSSHGYFKSAPDSIRQAISGLAHKYKGKFNKEYRTWEFRTPSGMAEPLYREITNFIACALSEAKSEPPQIKAQSDQRTAVPARSITSTTAEPTFSNESDEETFRERAAILEFENKLSREEAERIAIREILIAKSFWRK